MWRLVRVSPSSEIHIMVDSPMIIGRVKRSHVQCCSANVSRRHCRLDRDETSGVWSAVDLQSANGTFVNGVRLPPGVPHSLTHGDQLSLSLVDCEQNSSFVFTVIFDSQPAEGMCLPTPRPAAAPVSSTRPAAAPVCSPRPAAAPVCSHLLSQCPVSSSLVSPCQMSSSLVSPCPMSSSLVSPCPVSLCPVCRAVIAARSNDYSLASSPDIADDDLFDIDTFEALCERQVEFSSSPGHSDSMEDLDDVVAFSQANDVILISDSDGSDFGGGEVPFVPGQDLWFSAELPSGDELPDLDSPLKPEAGSPILSRGSSPLFLPQNSDISSREVSPVSSRENSPKLSLVSSRESSVSPTEASFTSPIESDPASLREISCVSSREISTASPGCSAFVSVGSSTSPRTSPAALRQTSLTSPRTSPPSSRHMSPTSSRTSPASLIQASPTSPRTSPASLRERSTSLRSSPVSLRKRSATSQKASDPSFQQSVDTLIRDCSVVIRKCSPKVFSPAARRLGKRKRVREKERRVLRARGRGGKPVDVGRTEDSSILSPIIPPVDSDQQVPESPSSADHQASGSLPPADPRTSGSIPSEDHQASESLPSADHQASESFPSADPRTSEPLPSANSRTLESLSSADKYLLQSPPSAYQQLTEPLLSVNPRTSEHLLPEDPWMSEPPSSADPRTSEPLLQADPRTSEPFLPAGPRRSEPPPSADPRTSDPPSSAEPVQRVLEDFRLGNGVTLPPEVHYVLSRVLKWNTRWLKEQLEQSNPPTLGCSTPLQHASLTYQSHAQYVATFRPLLLHELWSSAVEHYWRSAARHHSSSNHVFCWPQFDGESVSQQVQTKRGFIVLYYTVGIPSGVEHPSMGHLVTLYLRLLPSAGSSGQCALFGFIYDRRTTVNHYAGAQSDSADSSKLVYFYLRVLVFYKNQFSIVDWTKKARMKIVCQLRPSLRKFSNIERVQQSPLLPALLLPDAADREHYFSTPQCTQPLVFQGELNSIQKEVVIAVGAAARQALDTPYLGIIQGPPGTGKTRTIVALIEQILFSPPADSHVRLLICAPSNTAVDEITERIAAQRGTLKARGHQVRLVRYGVGLNSSAVARKYSIDELVRSNVQKELRVRPSYFNNEIEELHERLRSVLEKQRAASSPGEICRLKTCARQIAKRLESLQSTSKVSGRELRALQQKCRTRLLRHSNIVVTTLGSCYGTSIDVSPENCSNQSSGEIPQSSSFPNSTHVDLASLFGRYKGAFTCCIVDEAGQCTEPEALAPLLHRINKIILVGDSQQLPPTVVSQTARRHGLGSSLMERLEQIFLSSAPSSPCRRVFRLSIQYRMHEQICRWPASRFYGQGALLTAPCVYEQLRKFSCLQPYRLFDISHCPPPVERRSTAPRSVSSTATDYRSNSLSNEQEAKLVVLLCRAVLSLCHQRAPSIGVITPYQNQRNLIADLLKRHGCVGGVDVRTIDGFQGQQRDVIIVSAVRGQHCGVGFLADYRRLNVALTRARAALYICCCCTTLQVDEYWSTLFADASSRGLVTRLRPSVLHGSFDGIVSLIRSS